MQNCFSATSLSAYQRASNLYLHGATFCYSDFGTNGGLNSGSLSFPNNYYTDEVGFNVSTKRKKTNGTLTANYNFQSRNFIKNTLGWDASIWILEDGQYPKLWFELE